MGHCSHFCGRRHPDQCVQKSSQFGKRIVLARKKTPGYLGDSKKSGKQQKIDEIAVRGGRGQF